MSKEAVTKIVEGIGPKKLAKELSVSDHSVRYAKTSGAMPASWYAPVKALCEASDIECPMSAFSFKELSAGGKRGNRKGGVLTAGRLPSSSLIILLSMPAHCAGHGQQQRKPGFND